MKRTSVVTWVIVLVAIAIPLCAGAAVPVAPHDGSGITCTTCHTGNALLPGGLTGSTTQPSPAFYNNVCQSCHKPGDANAGSKPLSPSDASVVFGGHTTNAGTSRLQTSHRWDGSDVNPAAGAQPPIQAAMTSPYLQGTQGKHNLRGRSGNQLACVRCHSVHIANNNNGHALRMANDQDQMCLDCHRSRNQQSHLSGTHPVNINYNSTPGAFLKPPLNANPSNPTSDLSAKLTSTGNIVCSTCHGVHYTDSRSSTFDGASSAKGRNNYANLSSGDGYILRTDLRGGQVSGSQTFDGQDKLNLCTNCHANKKNHNAVNQDVQCADCHGAHVDYDKDDPNNAKGTNVYLVRRDVAKAGIPGKVYFRYTGSQREYKTVQGTGVCQGCHDIPPPGGKYPPEHASSKASDCNKCHYHNNMQSGSFSGACGKCHGNPPTTADIGGPTGLATPVTGALAGAAGAHAVHVNSRKMDCNTCHNRYGNKIMPSTSIDLEFNINPATFPGFKGNAANGSYNTPAPNAGYAFTGPVNINGANRTCSNVYCHGGTLPPGTISQPSWIGGASQATCGTCHSIVGNALYGSHPVHAGGSMNLACATCHPALPANDTSHMQGSVQWNLNGVSVSAQYKPAGGTYAAAGETGRLAPSTTYGNCNAVYCHGQATNIPWGGTLWSTTETCAKCHSSQASVTSSGTFYSTAYPVKQTSSTNSKVGTHVSHLAGTDSMSGNLNCTDCHGSVTAVNSANHMNGSTNFKWAKLANYSGKSTPVGILTPVYNSATGTCSNVYCHGASLSGGTNKTPTWNVSFLPTALTPDACDTCHGFPPSTSSHFGISKPSGFPTTSCGCHPNLNSSGTSYATIFVNKALHINGVLNVSGGCNGCHGYPPSNKRFRGTHNNWSSARQENYSGGGGAHTVAGHIPPTATQDQGWVNCTNCHNPSDHVMSPLVYNPSSNIKVGILPRVRFSNIAPQAKYSSNRLDGAAHISGKCTNVACHFQKSPTW